MAFSLDQAANVTVTVLDSANSVIRTVTRNESRAAGDTLSTWDGDSVRSVGDDTGSRRHAQCHM